MGKVLLDEGEENGVYYVQQYQAADFRQWKDHDASQKAFSNLLRDLKNPQAR